MKLVRFSAKDQVKYGLLEEAVIKGYAGDPFADMRTGKLTFKPDNSVYKLAEVKLLAPCEPSKIICLGLNYRSHVAESHFKEPASPLIFLKPPSALIAAEEFIVIPDLPERGRTDYEGEVAVVIGKTATDVSLDKAMDYVYGYTIVNDVSARLVLDTEGQWTRGKGFDTFCPMGPCIATLPSPDKIKVETILNGEVKQSSDTSYLIFNIPTLVSFLSSSMTLFPGDIISTGTPRGVGRIHPGDTVEIKVEGVGTLRNYVKDKVKA